MRRAAFLVLLALVASALPAHAGDAKNPEITDPPNDAGAGAAWGDITAGWFNDSATDISMTLQLAQLAPTAPNGYTWYVLFTAGTGTNASLGCYAFLFAGSPTFDCAHWDPQQGPKDSLGAKGTMTPGQPGTIELHMDKAKANNVTRGTALTKVNAGTGTVAFVPTPAGVPPVPFGQFVPDDSATGKDYVLANGPAAASATGAPASPGATPSPPGTPSPAPSGAPDTNSTAGTNSTDQGATPAKTPGPEPVLAAGSIALAVLAVRRRAAR